MAVGPSRDWSGALVFSVIFLGLVFIVTVLFQLSQDNQTERPTITPELESFAINERLPERFTVTTEEGQTVSLLSLIKQPTLVTLWKSTCNECLPALTSQQRFSQENPTISLISVNFRESPESAREFLKKNQLDLPIYFDREGSLFNQLSATIPASYLIEDGVIRYYFPGRITEDLLKKLFARR